MVTRARGTAMISAGGLSRFLITGNGNKTVGEYPNIYNKIK
jgi:hypothetical protein